MNSFDEYIMERNEALSSLNLDWARSVIPGADSEALLCAMHKARYECSAIAKELRHESGAWLKDRGFKRLGGFELLDEGILPT